MKRILTVCILLVALTLTGCASVTVTSRFNRDGSYSKSVSVALDAGAVSAYGYTLQEAVDEVAEVMRDAGYEVITGGNVVTGYINYSALEMSGVSGVNTQEADRGNVFFNVYESESDNLLYVYLDEKVLGEYWDSFGEYASEDFADVDMTYIYVTPYRNVTSNGEVTYENGYYVHRWYINRDNIDRKIRLTKTVPFTPAWYLTAMAVAVAGAGISLLIYLRRKAITGK